MPPRAPRPDPVRADCDALRELASAYLPTLRFAEGEAFYPLRAESWLTQTTMADWPETAGRHGDDLPTDERRRGTTLVSADAQVQGLTLLAGTPLHDRPLSLDADLGDENAIGRYRTRTDDTFLVVGGWPDGGARTTGDQDYLRRSCSELGGAAEGTLPWEPLEVDPAAAPHLPATWVAQPVTPTVYAEIEWTGMFPTWARTAGLGDFAPEAGGGRLESLDQFLSITYYFLYAARHPIDAASGPTRMEGQWEAVSLLFRAEGGPGSASGVRPSELTVHETPEWVVISQNLVGGTHRMQAARWREVRKLRIPFTTTSTLRAAPFATTVESTSCVLFVGRGSHAFHFEPTTGHDWADEAAPGSDLSLSLDEDLFWGQLLWSLLWLLLIVIAIVIAVILATLLAVVIAVVAVIVLLILLIASLFALFSDHGSETEPHPSNEEAGGTGPQGGTSEPPANDPHSDTTGGSGPASGTPAPDAGTPNAGSPSGMDSLAFDLRVVDLLHHAEDRTGFPPQRKCEHPAWWDYTGGWGVRVRPSMASGWSSGMRRLDEQQRSWGYFAAAEVARRLDA